MTEKLSVLFVCMGNICRSPLAEGVFRHLVAESGLTDRFEIDSAGTSSYHVGEPPDARSANVARQRCIRLTGKSRAIAAADLERFDYVIAMDDDNLLRIRQMAARKPGRASVHLLRDFDGVAKGANVPDPYYGGPHGFEDVHDIVDRSCRAFLSHLRERHQL
jgi:protein-tyrosine phosphatase